MYGSFKGSWNLFTAQIQGESPKVLSSLLKFKYMTALLANHFSFECRNTKYIDVIHTLNPYTYALIFISKLHYISHFATLVLPYTQ